ncbi:MAG: response regulator transcription factor [Thermoguttaceae bacterium]|jgi:DNA-binding NarL/FixJ family response regulator
MSADSTPKSTLSLLIADDHALLREGLLLMFQNFQQVAAIGVAFQDAPLAAEQHNPDVAILGLGAKHGQSWSTVQTLCRQCPKTCLLILDETVRTRNIRKALALEICGYWTKHATFEQIAQAARQLAAGRRSFCPEVDQYLFRTRRGLRYHPAHTGNPLQMLTPRETELLALLASGLTLKKCSERMAISINTVDNHKTRLMRKLGVHKTVELARLAMREGLVMEE